MAPLVGRVPCFVLQLWEWVSRVEITREKVAHDAPGADTTQLDIQFERIRRQNLVVKLRAIFTMISTACRRYGSNLTTISAEYLQNCNTQYGIMLSSGLDNTVIIPPCFGVAEESDGAVEVHDETIYITIVQYMKVY